MTADFPTVAMPASVCLQLHAALEAGAQPRDLCILWRERDGGGAVVLRRADVAARQRRAGQTVWSRKIVAADVPAGRVLVFVELRAGRNLTYGSLPKRPPPVLVAPAPALQPVDDDDVVLVRPRARVRVDRARSPGSAAYRRDLAALLRAPGVPPASWRTF